VGGGRWIVFQKVVGGSLDDVVVLTTLLARFASGARPVGSAATAGAVSCDGDTFAALCGRIVRGVLVDWAGRPTTRTTTAAGFLRLNLGERLAEGKPLAEEARRLTGSHLDLPGEDRPLVNPFGLIANPGSDTVRALVGRTHGDLHPENILVPVRRTIDTSPYRLIDLAKYSNDGPLTRDPVHLVLAIVARTLADLSDPQCDALLEVLLDPDSAAAEQLPGWLYTLISTVRRQGEEWVYEYGLLSEWRDQTRLSLVACALMLHARPTTRVPDRSWFLRLAARAADAYSSR
jgi:hypothetical protein